MGGAKQIPTAAPSTRLDSDPLAASIAPRRPLGYSTMSQITAPLVTVAPTVAVRLAIVPDL